MLVPNIPNTPEHHWTPKHAGHVMVMYMNGISVFRIADFFEKVHNSKIPLNRITEKANEFIHERNRMRNYQFPWEWKFTQMLRLRKLLAEMTAEIPDMVVHRMLNDGELRNLLGSYLSGATIRDRLATLTYRSPLDRSPFGVPTTLDDNDMERLRTFQDDDRRSWPLLLFVGKLETHKSVSARSYDIVLVEDGLRRVAGEAPLASCPFRDEFYLPQSHNIKGPSAAWMGVPPLRIYDPRYVPNPNSPFVYNDYGIIYRKEALLIDCLCNVATEEPFNTSSSGILLFISNHYTNCLYRNNIISISARQTASEVFTKHQSFSPRLKIIQQLCHSSRPTVFPDSKPNFLCFRYSGSGNLLGYFRTMYSYCH